MFKEYLLSAKSNKVPVSLYTSDPKKFSFGFVQGVSDNWILLANISPDGFYDGFIIRKYEDVFRCDSKDKYGERIHKLYQIRKQNHPIVDLSSDDLLTDLIQYAQKHQLVVSVELRDSSCIDLQGLIDGIQDDLITIEQLDDDGNADGESIVSFEAITRVDCDTDIEMSIKLLADSR